MAKVALRFECAKQSKNHKKYLLNHTVIREKTNVKNKGVHILRYDKSLIFLRDFRKLKKTLLLRFFVI